VKKKRRDQAAATGGTLASAEAGAPAVSVRQLLHDGGSALRLHLAAGRSGLDHLIHLARVQRPGLALTGFTEYLRYGPGPDRRLAARSPTSRS
jgi:hypothetical protein